jgi:molybdate transport system substrate-binding protein
MKRYGLSLLLALTAALGFSQTVVVAAAANLSAVEAPLQKAFADTHPGMQLQFTFGSSGTLVTQILNGAPFQVFLSADRGFAQKVVDAKLATGPVKTYAVGKLIFLSTTPIDAGKGLSLLLDPKVAQFAVANPETAPYGKAAVEALTKAGLYDQVKAKQLTAQSIAQAAQFAVTAGFGFINKSAILSKELAPYSKEGQFWFEVDPKLYSPIEQGYVVLDAAAAKPEVKAFDQFLLSDAAQKVFAAYGYGKPQK